MEMARRNRTQDEETAVGTEPNTVEPAEGARGARGRNINRISRAISDAQRDFNDATNRVSEDLNDAICRAYRNWVASQHNTHAEFQGHLDQGLLNQDLQKAGDAYWNEVRDLTQDATRRLADTYRGYLGAIKDAVAAIDVQDVDPGTLTFLAQTLNSAAAFAAQQPPVPRAA
jgi:hypothetical protein